MKGQALIWGQAYLQCEVTVLEHKMAVLCFETKTSAVNAIRHLIRYGKNGINTRIHVFH